MPDRKTGPRDTKVRVAARSMLPPGGPSEHTGVPPIVLSQHSAIGHTGVMAHRSARRAFGFWICLALVIGNMIGSGVFALPSALAPFGWNIAIAWLVTIGGALCLAFVFARLARGFPEAGGPYAYTREAFGPAA